MSINPSSTRPGLASVRPQTNARLLNWADRLDTATDTFCQVTEGFTHAQLARRINKDESTIRRTREGGLHVSVALVDSLPPDLASRFWRIYLARAEEGAQVVPVESSQRRIAAASGSLALELERALADGKLDPEERERLSTLMVDISLLAARGATGVRRVG